MARDQIRKHKKFIEKAMKYFDVNHPIVITYCDDVDDIAVIDNVILVGQKWIEAPTPEQEKRIVHEFLHIALGLDDNIDELGFYSDPEKDELSRRVYEHMKMHPKFDIGLIYENPVGKCTEQKNFLREHISDPSQYSRIRTIKRGDHRIVLGYDGKGGKKYGVVSILHPKTKEEYIKCGLPI